MTRETITLTQEEQRRVVVLTAVRKGRLKVPKAADLLQFSVRHTKRLLAAFRREGPAALVHEIHPERSERVTIVPGQDDSAVSFQEAAGAGRDHD